jgi:hypothetical protein
LKAKKYSTLKNAVAYYNAGFVAVNSKVVGLALGHIAANEMHGYELTFVSFSRILSSGTDVMIFKIFSPKNSAKKLAFMTQNKVQLCKILIITLGFKKNANFFRRNLSKIAENCDHNIDPSFADSSSSQQTSQYIMNKLETALAQTLAHSYVYTYTFN